MVGTNKSVATRPQTGMRARLSRFNRTCLLEENAMASESEWDISPGQKTIIHISINLIILMIPKFYSMYYLVDP
jgi:hypothetical protein